MARVNRHDFFLQCRERFPYFEFTRQEWSVNEHGLDIRYTFSLAGQYTFKPTLFIPAGLSVSFPGLAGTALDNIVFQIGMIELISYWKAACPPRVIIRPFALRPEQADWWRRLYFHGLGEFLYLNSIDVREEDLMTIECISDQYPGIVRPELDEGILVPIGGGKDSAVTLEILRKHATCYPLIVNPRSASLETVLAAGFKREEIIEIRRTLDPMLLQLNDQGFLNGHTPFSALLAFVTALSALVSGHRHIALSNESSANEATIEGTDINHQYSKSFRFESDFREYSRRWICGELDYFSFLRPLNELQIAGLFAKMQRYHPVFRSCNAGSKTDSWCGRCAKCLFTYTILSPFIRDEELVQIFGADLFADESLVPVLDQLAGIAAGKPFDCVGTLDEVNLALCEAIRQRDGLRLPALLAYYKGSMAYQRYFRENFRNGLVSISTEHHLDARLEGWLKSAIEG